MSDGGFGGGAGGEDVVSVKLQLDTSGLQGDAAKAGQQAAEGFKSGLGNLDLNKALNLSGIVPSGAFSSIAGHFRSIKGAAEEAGEASKKSFAEHAAGAERAALSVGALTAAVRSLGVGLSTGSFREAGEGLKGIAEGAAEASLQVGGLASVIRTVGPTVTAIGAGLGAALGIEIEKIKQAKEAADINKGIRNTSILTGSSVEGFLSLQHILAQSGVDVENLDRVFIRLAQTVAETSSTIVKDLKDEQLQIEDTAASAVEADRKVEDAKRAAADSKDKVIDADRAMIDSKRALADAQENAREASAKAAVEGAHAAQEQGLQANQLENLGPAGAELNVEAAAIRLKRYQITHDAFGNRRMNPMAGFELKQLKVEEEQLKGRQLQLGYASALQGLQEANLKAQESREYRGMGLSPTGGPGPAALSEKLQRSADAAAEAIDKLREAIAGRLVRAIEAAAENVGRANDDIARAERDRTRAQDTVDRERFTTIRGARRLIEGGGSPEDINQIQPGIMKSALVAQAMDQFGGGSVGVLQAIGSYIRNNVPEGDAGMAAPAGQQAIKMMEPFLGGSRFLRTANLPAMFDALRNMNPQNLEASRQTPYVQDMLKAVKTGEKPLEEVEKTGIGLAEDQRLRTLKQGTEFAPDAVVGMQLEQKALNATADTAIAAAKALDTFNTAIANVILTVSGLKPGQQSSLPVPGGPAAVDQGARNAPLDVVPPHARGGPISGPGTSTSDSIPAMLSDGEYVVRADAVRNVGLPFLDAINAGRGMADGGPVVRLSSKGSLIERALLSMGARLIGGRWMWGDRAPSGESPNSPVSDGFIMSLTNARDSGVFSAAIPLAKQLAADGSQPKNNYAGLMAYNQAHGVRSAPSTDTYELTYNSDGTVDRKLVSRYVATPLLEPALRFGGLVRHFAKGGPVTLSGMPAGFAHVPGAAGVTPALMAATMALRSAALEGGPGVLSALAAVGAAGAGGPIDLSHIAGGLLTFTRNERAGALWSNIGPNAVRGFGGEAGIPAPAGSHSLDLVTAGGTFSVWAAVDTIESIRSSALGDRLTSTGTRPSWFS